MSDRTPNFIFKGTPLKPDPFWSWFGMEMATLSRRYPYMDAYRSMTGERAGEWVIKNMAAAGDKGGERAFRDLAVQAANKLGYHGGPEGGVQFFLDHMHGDHAVKAKLPIKNMNEVDYLTETVANGELTREMHLGKYKQSGVDWVSDPVTSEPAPVDHKFVTADVTEAPKMPSRQRIRAVTKKIERKAEKKAMKK